MTLREAITVLLDEESVGDFIYAVRERAAADAYKGNSWDHPRVTRYNTAVNTLREALKDLP